MVVETDFADGTTALGRDAVDHGTCAPLRAGRRSRRLGADGCRPRTARPARAPGRALPPADSFVVARSEDAQRPVNPGVPRPADDAARDPSAKARRPGGSGCRSSLEYSGAPGAESPDRSRRATGLPPSGLAASTMPFDSMPISFAGFRLKTITIVRPTSASGSYASAMPATSVRCSVPTSTISLTSFREFGTFSAASTLATRSSTFMKSSMVILSLPAAGAGGGAAAGAAGGTGGAAAGGVSLISSTRSILSVFSVFFLPFSTLRPRRARRRRSSM